MSKRIDFTVQQTKINQDAYARVPDEIYEAGEKAIIDWLWDNGHIDNALDHAETKTEVNPYRIETKI